MKKFLIGALAIVMVGTMAACGEGNVGVVSSTPSQAASSQVQSKPSADSYEDNLTGLEKYLTANSVLSGDPVTMQAEFIGAKSGAKYQFGFNGNNNVTAELYEFAPDSLNDTAKTVQSDVKSKGSFTMMGQQVKAVLSDSGKYLMIYKDTATADQNKAREEQVTKLFKEFHK